MTCLMKFPNEYKVRRERMTCGRNGEKVFSQGRHYRHLSFSPSCQFEVQSGLEGGPVKMWKGEGLEKGTGRKVSSSTRVDACTDWMESMDVYRDFL
jgi:hypothetical protein